MVQAMLSVMDNIWSYEELVYNFEYLGPKMIELFSSHQQCLEYLDGLICLLLLPQTITATKEAVAKPTLAAHTTFVWAHLMKLLASNASQVLRSPYAQLLCCDTGMEPIKPPGCKDDVSLTPSETQVNHTQLTSLLEDYPEYEGCNEVYQVLRWKVRKQQGGTSGVT